MRWLSVFRMRRITEQPPWEGFQREIPSKIGHSLKFTIQGQQNTFHFFLKKKVCKNTLNNDKDLIQLQAFCQLYIMFFATFPIWLLATSSSKSLSIRDPLGRSPFRRTTTWCLQQSVLEDVGAFNFLSHLVSHAFRIYLKFFDVFSPTKW